MPALFNNAAGVHHEDAIAALDGGEGVRDGDDRPLVGQPFQGQ